MEEILKIVGVYWRNMWNIYTERSVEIESSFQGGSH